MSRYRISAAETRIKGRVVAEQPVPAKIVLKGSTGEMAKRLRAEIAELKRRIPRQPVQKAG